MSTSLLAFVILLSLCLFFQMLGVPAPLLDAGASLEINESSIQEGWAIHISYAFLPPGSHVTSIVDADSILHMPILARALFRPPVR